MLIAANSAGILTMPRKLNIQPIECNVFLLQIAFHFQKIQLSNFRGKAQKNAEIKACQECLSTKPSSSMRERACQAGLGMPSGMPAFQMADCASGSLTADISFPLTALSSLLLVFILPRFLPLFSVSSLKNLGNIFSSKRTVLFY